MKRRFLRWLAALAAAALLALAGGGYVLHRAYYGERMLAEPVLVRIPPGASVGASVRLLCEAGIGGDPTRVLWGLKLWRGPRTVKAGVYRFAGATSPAEAMTVLSEGRVDLVAVTLLEGWGVREIDAALARAGVCEPPGRFAAYALTADAARDFGLPGPTLEGYLFPDTYRFARELPPEVVVRTLVERFREVARELAGPGEDEPEALLRWVTLASIVEKETGRAEERPLIASVFANRLAKGMRLESDPTVIYGVEDFDGNLRREDLKRDTPYNTYTRRGVPPGPIASPGRESLAAVLAPPETPYFYFVSRGDGTHKFSETYEAHAKAVRRYQIEGRR